VGFWHDVGLGTISIVSAAIIGISLDVIAIMPSLTALPSSPVSFPNVIFSSATVTLITFLSATIITSISF
jgi:hypothetical protein